MGCRVSMAARLVKWRGAERMLMEELHGGLLCDKVDEGVGFEF